jgi:hypothetical protein
MSVVLCRPMVGSDPNPTPQLVQGFEIPFARAPILDLPWRDWATRARDLPPSLGEDAFDQPVGPYLCFKSVDHRVSSKKARPQRLHKVQVRILPRLCEVGTPHAGWRSQTFRPAEPTIRRRNLVRRKPSSNVGRSFKQLNRGGKPTLPKLDNFVERHFLSRRPRFGKSCLTQA